VSLNRLSHEIDTRESRSYALPPPAARENPAQEEVPKLAFGLLNRVSSS